MTSNDVTGQNYLKLLKSCRRQQNESRDSAQTKKFTKCITIASGVPRPEVGVGGEVVKPFVYRQWQLRHMTLVKSVNTTASIRTTHFCLFHKV